jgi:hypothetical protein
MQRERDIHEQLFVGGNHAGGEAELFSISKTTGAIGNDRASAEGSVEWFGDPDEEAKEGKTKDFGDNVELF